MRALVMTSCRRAATVELWRQPWAYELAGANIEQASSILVSALYR
jgi:hypothetical protein